jgi:GNAT superfamily N-acetyltransferase
MEAEELIGDRARDGRGPAIRPATLADLAGLRRVMARAIAQLQDAFLTPEQVAASRAFMGLDTQLVVDGTYFAVEEGSVIIGCGGWSRRATLYGGDHSAALRDAALLDPARDAARVRAMYTDPAHVRRGIGTLILAACERAAAAEGFTRVQLMGTMSGRPLYAARGYAVVEETAAEAGGVAVPLVRMEKRLPA